MKSDLDRQKTLTELEERDWGPPNFGSHLVITIHQLRHKPLEQFTVEDLRITIGQNIALEWLLPMAIERLRDDPFAEGDFYRGDLLNAVLGIRHIIRWNIDHTNRGSSSITIRRCRRRPKLRRGRRPFLRHTASRRSVPPAPACSPIHRSSRGRCPGPRHSNRWRTHTAIWASAALQRCKATA